MVPPEKGVDRATRSDAAANALRGRIVPRTGAESAPDGMDGPVRQIALVDEAVAVDVGVVEAERAIGRPRANVRGSVRRDRWSLS